jgi:hypothetical protein
MSRPDYEALLIKVPRRPVTSAGNENFVITLRTTLNRESFPAILARYIKL